MPPARYLLGLSFLLVFTLHCSLFAPKPPPQSLPPPTLPPPLLADNDRLAQILADGLLRICLYVSPDAAFAPPAFRGGSNAATGGSLKGFEVELAHLLAERMTVMLELVETSRPIILSGNWQNRCDIALASLTPFDQPSPLTVDPPLLYSRPYGYLPIGLLVRQAETRIENLTDLENRSIGVLQETAHERLLTTSDLTVQGQSLTVPLPPSVNVVPLSTMLQATSQLSQTEAANPAQIEAIVGPTPMLQQAINTGWPVKFAAQTEIMGYQPVAVALSPQDGLPVERLLTEINRILTELDEQAVLAEVYYRWYDKDFSRIGF